MAWLCVLGILLGIIFPNNVVLAEENQRSGVELGAENGEGTNTGSQTVETTSTAEFGLTTVSAVLMEASTGTVIYEKNADER